MGLENNHKVNEKEINHLMKKVTDKKTIDTLNYVNENVLIEFDEKAKNTISIQAENLGRDIGKEHSKKAQEFMAKSNKFKDSLEVGDNGLISKKYEFEINEKTAKEVTNLKISLNDKTKSILKKALTKIEKMKDLNGNPIIESEINPKGTMFKNLYNIHDKIQEIVESKDENRLDELNTLASKHKEYADDLDELIQITNGYDSEAFVPNSSVARISTLSSKYVEDVKGSSRINNLYILANYIKASGSTIDDYVNNPIQVMNNYVKKHSGFKSLNDFGNSKGDVEFINEAMKNSSLFGETSLKVSQAFGPSLRFLIGSSMLQKENEAENRFAADAYSSLLASEMTLQARKFNNNYFKDNQLQTVKNILINTSKNKDYVALCQTSDKYIDPFTGKKSGSFEYDKFLSEGKVNIKELAAKFDAINANLSKKDNKIIKDAIKEISLDIVNSKQYDNSFEFDKFQKFAGLNSIELYNQRRGKTNYKTFIENEYNELNKDGFKKENVNKSLNLVKAISDKYNSRTWLGKMLWGRKEGKLLDRMKNDLTSNGINKDTLDSYLKGIASKEELSNAKPNIEKKDTKIQIKVDLGEEKENIKENIKVEEFSKEVNKEKETDNLKL